MNLGKTSENYVKSIIHKSYYNFKYGKNHKRGAQIPEVWGSPTRRHRLHASEVAGTLSALPMGLCFSQTAPPIAHFCLGSFLRTALQIPPFWWSPILQRLVKPSLLCKASPAPCSPISLVFATFTACPTYWAFVFWCVISVMSMFSFCSWKKGAGSSFRVGTVS